jgi:hypothetical protein
MLDENLEIKDNEPLPLSPTLKVLRYKTIKKNNALGWWSAVVLLEDHEKKQVCFYRWRRKKKEWKRDKKLTFHSGKEWILIRDTVEGFIKDLS